MPAEKRITEKLLLRHDTELHRQAGVEHGNVERRQMVGSIDGRLRRANVVESLDAHANQGRLQDHARPGAREPVLYAPFAIRQRREQRERPQHSRVQIDHRREKQIRTQTAQQRAPARFATFDLWFRIRHRVMPEYPSRTWPRRPERWSLSLRLVPAVCCPGACGRARWAPSPRRKAAFLYARPLAAVRWWWPLAGWRPWSRSPAGQWETVSLPSPRAPCRAWRRRPGSIRVREKSPTAPNAEPRRQPDCAPHPAPSRADGSPPMAAAPGNGPASGSGEFPAPFAAALL